MPTLGMFVLFVRRNACQNSFVFCEISKAGAGKRRAAMYAEVNLTRASRRKRRHQLRNTDADKRRRAHRQLDLVRTSD